jgi:hypothetical protein
MKAIQLFSLLLMLCAANVFTLNLHGQVTIGDEVLPQSYSILEVSTDVTKGGIRLPQLTTHQRDSITAAAAFPGDAKARGLAIYNSDTRCYEYWNSKKWVSLCAGTANITLDPDTVLPKDVPPGGYGPSVPVTPKDEPEPSCGNTVPYTIGVVSGADFVFVSLTDQSTGTFTYTVEENRTALPRTAVIRITNTWTGEYKEYLITQNGDTSLCDGQAQKPAIDGTGTALCTGGSVILTVASPEQ